MHADDASLVNRTALAVAGGRAFRAIEGTAQRVHRERVGATMVLSFRLVDSNGCCIAVEMRAEEVRGPLHEGDRVALDLVAEEVVSDGIRRPRRIRNVTTDSVVIAWDPSRVRRALAPLPQTCAAAVVSSGTTLFAASLFGGGKADNSKGGDAPRASGTDAPRQSDSGAPRSGDAHAPRSPVQSADDGEPPPWFPSPLDPTPTATIAPQSPAPAADAAAGGHVLDIAIAAPVILAVFGVAFLLVHRRQHPGRSARAVAAGVALGVVAALAAIAANLA
jgi:hypothetical protein